MDGHALTLWTIRASSVFYFVAVLLILLSGREGPRWARAAWTLGCLAYLAHVVSAFEFHHGWSHEAAYVETARQTREMFGAGSGAGLYFNYVFTAVWLGDVIWWWGSPAGYAARRRWVSAAVHGFLAFLFFNGVVVFAAGPATRWAGAAATAILLAAVAARLLFGRRA